MLSILAPAACGRFGQSRDATLRLDANALTAVDRMTTARCEREQACGATADGACFERLRVATATDVGLSRCVTDVDESRLRQCTQMIRGYACGVPLREVTAFWPCTVGAICEAGPEEGTN